jgi:hypothetical protein
MEVWFFSYSMMALLCGLSFFQPTRQRLIICFAFCFEFWIHAALSDYISDDVVYYLSGGIFTCIVLAGIVMFAKPNKFTDQMVMACVASILLNVYGWMIYENYWKADSYNIAFYILYMIVAFIFLQKEGAKDENRNSGWLRLPYHKYFGFNREIHQEAEK